MDPLKLLLLAGGGYFLYETGLLSALTGGLIPAPSSAPASGTPSNPAVPSPSNPAVPTPSVNIRALMLSGAQPFVAPNGNFAKDNTGSPSAPMLPSYDWNWIYKSVRGRDAGSVAFPPGNITIDEWLGPAQSAGFSGLVSGRDAVVVNGITPEPKNPCTPVPGMGILARRSRSMRGMGRWIY